VTASQHQQYRAQRRDQRAVRQAGRLEVLEIIPPAAQPFDWLARRDPADLVGQMMGPHHQYPDGAVLFLGTMFAPTKDRDAPGMGFTHHPGDVVTIASEKLGALVNVVTTSETARPWTFGTAGLMRNLAQRGLL